jgi:hypothetical protein
LHLSAIPFKPSSSKQKYWRFNNTIEVMESRWRNMDNVWAVKFWLPVRRKDVSTCSDPIPSSNPPFVIFLQQITCSCWSLQHISNMTCQRTQTDSLITPALLVYWQCSVILFWKQKFHFTSKTVNILICNGLLQLFQANKT